jgi:hypothetical protein
MEEPEIKIPKSTLKKNEQQFALKSSKKDRRKKIYKFADAITKVEGKFRFKVSRYCCFECIHHRTKHKIQGNSICYMCSNGNYFKRKKDYMLKLEKIIDKLFKRR